MFELIIENTTDFEGRKLCEQFSAFIEQDGLLPSCSIHVHKCTYEPENLSLIENIGEVGLYRDEEFYYVRYNVTDRESVIVQITRDFRKMEVYYREITGKYLQCKTAAAVYFGYRYLAVSTGNLMIHSAAVVHRGEGILFCGVSGAGKSTQARLWIKHAGAVMLNADKPCLLCRDDEIIVHGTPWSGKEDVYVNSYAPVKCIAFVGQAEENRAERLSDAEAFSLLYLNNYIYPLTDELENQYVNVIEHISCSVPVYRLHCDRSEQAVKVLYEEVYGEEYTIQEER